MLQSVRINMQFEGSAVWCWVRIEELTPTKAVREIERESTFINSASLVKEIGYRRAQNKAVVSFALF